MKKFKVVVWGKVDKEKYFKRWKSSLFSVEDHKIYFSSKFEPKVEAEVEIWSLSKDSLNNSFLEMLINIYENSRLQAKELSIEPVDGYRERMSAEGPISSILMKYSYKDEGESTIFEFVRDLFVRMLMGHVLINGNKRTATVFLKTLLESFGYYFKWTEGFYKDYSKHKDKIEYFASELEHKGTYNENSHKDINKEILEWVESNALIGITSMVKYTKEV